MQSLSDFKKIIFLFLGWRALLFIIAAVFSQVIPLRPDYTAVKMGTTPYLSLLWPWANFDGVHYLSIATAGYDRFQYAFFPGYPGLIHFFSQAIDPLISSLLISNAAALAVLILLSKLWSLEFGKAVAGQGLILFLAFPSAFFLGSSYTESLFLVLVIGSFLAARKNNFGLAALLTAGASLTRLVGVFLIPALLIMWWLGKREKRNLVYIALAAVGFLGVILFNYREMQDPLYFFHVQPSFGAGRSGESLILLPQVIFRYIKIFLTSAPFTLTYFAAVQEFVLTMLALVTLAVGMKKVNFSYWMFSLGVLLTPTLTGTLSSMPRYVLAAFPIFALAAVLIKNRFLFWMTATLLMALQIFNVMLFTRGYWVS